MQTKHLLINDNANNIYMIPDKSVHLVVTSPPYPMVEMWDDIFCNQNPEIKKEINIGNIYNAFNKMHQILDNVWKECDRVLIDGGFVCINIGDATRTFNNKFQLFSNHTKIIETFVNMNYSVLPDIHWRKPTNSPNKFMGSGMYPAGAYVTYEHEYILIFRKGNKRIFSENDKIIRQQSAYFWEERNEWFSDLWEINGTSQKMSKGDRIRNGSYPLEIPYRLINMYSMYGDTVLDPFSGLGTTSLACMHTGRNSINIDISKDTTNLATERLMHSETKDKINDFINNRIVQHINFIENLSDEKRNKCYNNIYHNCLVKTKQETKLKLYKINKMQINKNIIVCDYVDKESEKK